MFSKSLQCWEFLLWMDTANYCGPKGKIPQELLVGEITQNSEAMNQTSEQTNEALIDMNWNMAEQLPEEGNCRAEFEAIMTLFLDYLVNKTEPVEAVKSISFPVFEIVQRLHKSYGAGKSSPALLFTNALVKALQINKNIEEEVMVSFQTYTSCCCC